MKKKNKRFFFNVVEEIVQNPDYFGYRGGRIEVSDEKDKSGYPIYEARFLIPEELYNGFLDWIDFKESDKMPLLEWRAGMTLKSGDRVPCPSCQCMYLPKEKSKLCPDCLKKGVK
jgi:hypothetical protein